MVTMCLTGLVLIPIDMEADFTRTSYTDFLLVLAMMSTGVESKENMSLRLEIAQVSTLPSFPVTRYTGKFAGNQVYILKPSVTRKIKSSAL